MGTTTPAENNLVVDSDAGEITAVTGGWKPLADYEATKVVSNKWQKRDLLNSSDNGTDIDATKFTDSTVDKFVYLFGNVWNLTTNNVMRLIKSDVKTVTSSESVGVGVNPGNLDLYNNFFTDSGDDLILGVEYDATEGCFVRIYQPNLDASSGNDARPDWKLSTDLTRTLGPDLKDC